jgi:hypothetical protein
MLTVVSWSRIPFPRIQGARAKPQVTDIRELPTLYQWDVFDGLHAEAIDGTPVVGGQRSPRQGISRHHMDQDRAGTRVMIETHDSVDPHTGKFSNYGVARLILLLVRSRILRETYSTAE